MDRYRTARNVAIVLALGAIVDFVPQGGRTANTFNAVLAVVFIAALAYAGGKLYLDHRITIDSLGDRTRAILYGAIVVGAVTVTAKTRMWASGFGELVWFALLALVVYALLAVYRSWRSY